MAERVRVADKFAIGKNGNNKIQIRCVPISCVQVAHVLVLLDVHPRSQGRLCEMGEGGRPMLIMRANPRIYDYPPKAAVRLGHSSPPLTTNNVQGRCVHVVVHVEGVLIDIQL